MLRMPRNDGGTITMLSAIKSFFVEQLSSAEVSEDPEHLLRLATTALLIEISRADAEVSADEESKILALVQRHFDLPPEETHALIAQADDHADEAVSLYQFTSVLNDHLSREERARVVELLWEIAFADQYLDKYEDFYVRKISDLLHVSHADFIRLKHRVKERAG